jgi:ElaB/YqjD/DUF883 family membrane-anchored ribosome-binding protein
MASPNVEQQIDTLRSDIAGLRSQLSGVLEASKRRGSDAAAALRERIEGLDHRVVEQLEQVADDALRVGKESLEAVEHQIEEHPYLTVAAAFGLGFLLSALLRK